MRWVIAAMMLFGALALVSCGDPCDRLADRICADLRDDRACERTRRDMEDFTPEICRSALGIYDKVRAR